MNARQRRTEARRRVRGLLRTAAPTPHAAAPITVVLLDESPGAAVPYREDARPLRPVRRE